MRRIILMYHGIGLIETYDRMGLNTPLVKFIEQIQCLLQAGWKVGTIDWLLGKAPPESPCAALSFDDGLASQLAAAQYLDSIKVKATFFIPVSCLGLNLGGSGYWSQWKCMTHAEVKSLKASGHEIGSHGTSHRGPLHRLAPADANRELSESREKLGKMIGERVGGFSYPYGGFSLSLARLVQSSGYAYGACSRPSQLPRTPFLYALPRIEVVGTDSMGKFQKKVCGNGEILRVLRYFISRKVRR